MTTRPPYTPPDHATLIPGFPGWHMIGDLLITPEGRIVFKNHPGGIYPKARTFKSVELAAKWLAGSGITSSLVNVPRAER